MNQLDKPLIVQSDNLIMAEADHPDYPHLKQSLVTFAELLKNPGHLHTYRISRLSLWNAAAGGMNARDVISFLAAHSKFSLPQNVRNDIYCYMDRYGLIQLISDDGRRLYLTSQDEAILQMLAGYPSLNEELLFTAGRHRLGVQSGMRGRVKQELIKLGYPVLDLAGYDSGEKLEVSLNADLRDYQLQAVDAFLSNEKQPGGSGIVELPCGSGKTIVGIAAMARLGCATLVLTTNVASVRQWVREILDKTNLQPAQVGEYTATCKAVKLVTVATYQIATHRKSKDEPFLKLNLLQERDWGFIIYDEVHLLPAPVFRNVAQLQATRRLGLTATLIREDGREEDVFSLVGPRLFHASWKSLEEQGWISQVRCMEVRVPLCGQAEATYWRAHNRSKFRIAGENPLKTQVLHQLVMKHFGEPTLIIGQYIQQLKALATAFRTPVICGEMPHDRREELYQQFRKGELSLLIVSKVANFAVDLPDAAVAIQISGSFGSRQEEAQRLGRILRPKQNGRKSYFYSLVSQDTSEQEFALKRQTFLRQQGYVYERLHAEQLQVMKDTARESVT